MNRLKKYLFGIGVLSTFACRPVAAQESCFGNQRFYGSSSVNAFIACSERLKSMCDTDVAAGYRAEFQQGIADLYGPPPKFYSTCYSPRPWYSCNVRSYGCVLEGAEPDLFPRTFILTDDRIQKLPGKCVSGSIINPSRQTVAEAFPISGTSISLYYTTEYDTANLSNHSYQLLFQIPTGATNMTLVMDRNGEHTEAQLPVINGTSNVIYQSFIDETRLLIPPDIIDMYIETSTSWINGYGFTGKIFDQKGLKIGDTRNYNPKPWGLGGMTITNHHFLDIVQGRVYWGFGSISEVTPFPYHDQVLGDVFIVPNDDESEIYVFDSLGIHQETRSGLLGVRLFKFEYDNQKRLLRIIDKNNRELRFERLGSGELSRIVSFFGEETNIQMNAFGRVTKITDSAGRVHEINYNENKKLVSSIVYPSGNITNFTFDSLGHFTGESKSNGGGKSLIFRLFNDQRIVDLLTAEGVSDSFTSSFAGGVEQTESVGAFSDVERAYYSGNNSEIHRGNVKVTTHYTSSPRFGNAVRFVDSRTTEVSSGWGPKIEMQVQASFSGDPVFVDSLVQSVIANSKTTEQRFTRADRILKVTTPMTRQFKTYLNDSEEIIKTEAPGQLPMVMEYDSTGMMDKTKNGLRETTFEYDSLGYLSSITNVGSLRSLRFERDGAGRVKKEIKPNGDVTQYSYSSKGSLANIVTPNGDIHSFETNIMDDIVSYLPPLLGGFESKTVYTYDKDHRIAKISHPSGRDVVYTYFPGLNLLSKVKTSRGDYEYNYYGGKIQQAKSPDDYTTGYWWDGPNMVQQSLSVFNQYVATVDLEYNVDFKLSKIKIGNVEVAYRYDADGRLVGIGDESLIYSEDVTNGVATKRAVSTLGSIKSIREVTDDGSNLTTSTKIIPNTTQGQNIYHQISLINQLNGNAVLKDKTSSVVDGVEHRKESLLFYEYDKNGRLISVDKEILEAAGAAVRDQQRQNIGRYVFADTSNNHISSFIHGSKVTYATYDAQDRLLSLQGSVTRNFEYDGDGNVRNISNCLGSKVLEYDEFKNLRKVILPNGNIIRYYFDGAQRRAAKEVNGEVKEYYLWYDKSRLAAIIDERKVLKTAFIYGDGLAPSYIVKYGKKYKVFATPQGSIRKVVAMDGTVVQETDYDEYGAVTKSINPGFQPLGFNSGLYDFETKLVRFGARDYDPEVGRWTSKDPIGFGGGDTNLYGYVFHDPINFTDPSGLIFQEFFKDNLSAGKHLALSAGMMLAGGLLMKGALIANPMSPTMMLIGGALALEGGANLVYIKNNRMSEFSNPLDLGYKKPPTNSCEAGR